MRNVNGKIREIIANDLKRFILTMRNVNPFSYEENGMPFIVLY